MLRWVSWHWNVDYVGLKYVASRLNATLLTCKSLRREGMHLE